MPSQVHSEIINTHLRQHVPSPVLRRAAAGALLKMARCPQKFFGIGDATPEVMEALCASGILSRDNSRREYRCMLNALHASALATCSICPDGLLIPRSE